MNQDTFQWSDELVKEFVRWNFNREPHNYLPAAVKQFKEEKTKRDWEVLEQCPIEGGIYKVKRNSDNQVFKLGDTLCWGNMNQNVRELAKYNEGEIKMFVIDGNNIYAEANDNKVHLAIWQKVVRPKPLFVSEEGLEVFDEEQICFYVSEFRIRDRKAKNMLGISNKRFISREAAENYILKNKPLLSLNDVLSETRKAFPDVQMYEINIRNLAKEKLSK